MQVKKGMILQVDDLRVAGVRDVTEQDLVEWHRAYEGNMIGDDGESRLPPSRAYYEVARGTKVVVTRARVNPGRVELVNPVDGVTFQILKDRLANFIVVGG